jgi:hypothetical protein
MVVPTSDSPVFESLIVPFKMPFWAKVQKENSSSNELIINFFMRDKHLQCLIFSIFWEQINMQYVAAQLIIVYIHVTFR